jgi:hypothetical protein
VTPTRDETVVRTASGAGEAIDVVVGRHTWQVSAIERAEVHRIGDADVPAVRASDLVLPKLHAGGPQDARDIDQLLDLESGLETDVGAIVGDLSRDAVALWRRILERHGG